MTSATCVVSIGIGCILAIKYLHGNSMKLFAYGIKNKAYKNACNPSTTPTKLHIYSL
jgi:hypothetical protein